MPPQATGAYNQVKQALSIFSPFNKVDDGNENLAGDLTQEDEYESSLPDADIIQLKRQWTRDYLQYYTNQDISKSQDTSYNYWLGKQAKDSMESMIDANRSLVDNKIFEALETFLPIATRANPDPMVTIDPEAADQQLAELLENALAYQADKQKLRMKLKSVTRDWALFRIGCVKFEWDVDKNDIKTSKVNAKMLILDPDGYVEDGGYFNGEYIGERKRNSAATLIEMFPKKKEYITSKASGKMGTKLAYTEWWYKGTDLFFTMDDEVLGKYKNFHWNYDGEQTVETETGIQVELPIVGRNHFDSPQSPYLFLNVFSTQTQPHDETSLIMQNISIQDMINRRVRQIEHNVELQNNGLVVSGKFTDEQASLAATALRKGGAIKTPSEVDDVRTAVAHIQAPQLATDIFDNLNDSRSELANIFGTSGSTPQGIDSTDTVRGQIMVNQLDSSRIGGGVTEYIEQLADSIYNWWVQMMYVHYDEPHYAAALGDQGAQQLMQLRNTDLQGKIVVTVKEGSLIPKDPLTRRNEAVDLWSANAIDPITLYQKLDYPNPYDAAKQLLTWQMVVAGKLPPQAMFPDFQAPPMMQPGEQPQGGVPQQQPGTGGPAVNPENGPELAAGPPPPDSQGAVGQQSQQLLASTPIPQHI